MAAQRNAIGVADAGAGRRDADRRATGHAFLIEKLGNRPSILGIGVHHITSRLSTAVLR
jgi:hypothetical protein